MIHELKTLPEYFKEVWNNSKRFEIRKDDRNYQVGDILMLKEYIERTGFTGRYVRVKVTYILRNFPGLSNGYCAMSIHMNINS
jgi:ribosomal protein S28E/S33